MLRRSEYRSTGKARASCTILEGGGLAPRGGPDALTSPPRSPIIVPTRRSTPRNPGPRDAARDREATMFQPTARFISGAMLVAGIAALGLGQAVPPHKAEARAASSQAPRFGVDPLWPKPLPNNWLLGWTIGVWVDEQDYVWIIHRGAGGLHNKERGAALKPPSAECCRTAPPILVFNPAGDLVRSWGGPGPGYEWPQSNHGVHVDYKGNVWIGGTGDKEAHILKVTKDRQFLLQARRA